LGRGITEWLARAPGLDLIVTLLTVGPGIVGFTLGMSVGEGAGWGQALWLLVVSVAAQAVALIVWARAHELAKGKPKSRETSIARTLDAVIGPARNHLAVWWTAWAVPVFTLVRLAEYVVYPPLIWLVRFPRYKHGEWINISRHKMDGLVGYDLIWCLYCDWMTGVWSLGSEMLRNVESFWCPIRFSDTNKCENCKIDFPDVNSGWVKPEAGMEAVTATLREKYGRDGTNAWFGHPARLTVEGKEVEG
jgi:hypothetical protein